MKKTITAIALAGLLAGAGTAEAKPVTYGGKVTGGHKITFKRSGGKISKINTGFATVCLPTSSFYGSNTGVDRFTPPGSYQLGKKVKRNKLQKTAMWHAKVTKYYTVSARKKGRRIKGKLEMSFSYGLPTMDYYGVHLITYICHGTAKFSAKRR
jgi:hypothetical protein